MNKCREENCNTIACYNFEGMMGIFTKTCLY